MFTHKGQYLKPLLKIIGGKQKSRHVLYAQFPQYDHYVEPFLGSGAVFMGSPSVATHILNDVNHDIVNFYQQIQQSPKAVYGGVQHHLKLLHEGQKEYFYQLRDAREQMSDPVDRAVWLYVINKSCFNGIIRYSADGKCNSSYCGTTKGRGWMTREWLQAVHERLARTGIDSLDFRTLLEKIPFTQNTFMFLDPPYFLKGQEDPNGTVTVYNGQKFTTKDHEDLADALESIKSPWLMTINDCEWVRKRYAQFRVRENEIFYSCSQTPAGRGIIRELIIQNYTGNIQ